MSGGIESCRNTTLPFSLSQMPDPRSQSILHFPSCISKIDRDFLRVGLGLGLGLGLGFGEDVGDGKMGKERWNKEKNERGWAVQFPSENPVWEKKLSL